MAAPKMTSFDIAKLLPANIPRCERLNTRVWPLEVFKDRHPVLSGRPRTSWGLSQFSSDENGTVPLAKVEVVNGRPLTNESMVQENLNGPSRSHHRLGLLSESAPNPNGTPTCCHYRIQHRKLIGNCISRQAKCMRGGLVRQVRLLGDQLLSRSERRRGPAAGDAVGSFPIGSTWAWEA